MTQPGTIVGGRYEVVRRIADGGMGSVHEAVHLLSRKSVALKLLAPEVARDEAKRQRFLREVSAPAQIGHDGIVEVLDAGFDEKLGVLFVAMELLQGETLRDRLSRLDPRRSPEHRELLLDLFERILEPIAAAHARGIVHRDLKPENVFIARRRDGAEVVKILDFGIARELDTATPSVTQTGIAMGTPHYMAPEQAMSARDASFPADVWSLGAMLYEILSGKTPFPGETAGSIIAAAVTQAHPPVGAVIPGIPTMLSHLVDRCLAKRPEDRPAHAGVLLEELRRARGRAAPSIAAPASASQLPSPPPSSPTPPFGPAPADTRAPTGPPARTGPMPGQEPIGVASTMATDGLAAMRTGPPTPIATSPATSAPTANAPAVVAAEPAPASARSPTWVWVVAGLVLSLFGGGTCCAAGILGASLMGNDVSASLSDAPITWVGELSSDDRVADRGAYYDTFTVRAEAGDRMVVELSSPTFDTLLRVRTPSGATLQHDDNRYPIDTNSRIEVPRTEAGSYTIHVTSFRGATTGPYTVAIHR
ncbi:MAG: hypothetical protein OHK0013_34430 [Sandaracinaceae bacterium]